MHKEDLALNKVQWLVCHKTQEKTNYIYLIYTYKEHLVLSNPFSSKAMGSSMVLFTDPSARAGYDTRSIFKRSLTGLNSEFSFS